MLMHFPTPSNVLDAETAEELLRFFDKYPVLKIAGFSLWTFDEMTPEAAKVIARSGMDILFLDSVKVVPPETLRILCESEVSFLSLGIVRLSPTTARVLSRFRGACLKLDRLETISAEVAKILGRFPRLLSLNGVQTLGVDVAKALTLHRGELVLDGLVHLSEDVAQALSRHRCKCLGLEVLRFLSRRASNALAKYRGTLELPQLEVSSEE
ncbi:MAG: hypothetical protein ACKO38_06925 [Planctomycetota bacterium]